MDHVRRRTASTSLEWLLLGSLKRKRKRNTRRNTLAHSTAPLSRNICFGRRHTLFTLSVARAGSGRSRAPMGSSGANIDGIGMF